MELLNQPLRGIMSSRTVTVELDDTLADVKEIFDGANFHHLLVVEEGRLYGVLSDRDLLRALSPFIDSNVETDRDVATLNKRVHHVMTRRPVTLTPNDTVGDAVSVMMTRGVSCVPVVGWDQQPEGIVTWRDVFRVLQRLDVAATVAGSTPVQSDSASRAS